MNKNIAVIKGDGIGPEIVTEAMKVLDKVAEKFGHTFNYEQLLMDRKGKDFRCCTYGFYRRKHLDFTLV